MVNRTSESSIGAPVRIDGGIDHDWIMNGPASPPIPTAHGPSSIHSSSMVHHLWHPYPYAGFYKYLTVRYLTS